MYLKLLVAVAMLLLFDKRTMAQQPKALQQTSPSPQGISSIKLTNYKHADNSFEFLHPAGWQFLDNGLYDVELINQNETDLPGTVGPTSITVIIESVKRSTTIDSLKAGYRQQVLGVNTKLLTLENKYVDKYPGLYAEYIFNNDVDSTLCMQWSILKDGQQFDIVYSTGKFRDKNYKALGTKIINSFKFPAKLSISANEEQHNGIKVNVKDITLPNDTKFKWYNWKNAPTAIKTAASYIYVYRDRFTQEYVNLIGYISNHSECTPSVAIIDLNNDGVFGVAVAFEGRNCCGTLGCMFNVFENGGLLTTGSDNSHDLLPSQNGVKVDDGSLRKLVANSAVPVDAKKITSLFKYDKSKQFAPLPPKTTQRLIGGSTPAALGKLLFQALKNNDKGLWLACIHPDASPDNAASLVKSFQEIRTGFEEEGLENWALATYSRTTFKSGGSQHGDYPGLENGEKKIYFISAEFLYKGNAFTGSFALGAALTYKNANYFVESPGMSTYVFRSNANK